MAYPTQPNQPTGFVSIQEAARLIGTTPWDVVRLIEAAQVQTIQLVEVASLRKFQRESA